jgi:hypothetical protein
MEAWHGLDMGGNSEKNRGAAGFPACVFAWAGLRAASKCGRASTDPKVAARQKLEACGHRTDRLTATCGSTIHRNKADESPPPRPHLFARAGGTWCRCRAVLSSSFPCASPGWKARQKQTHDMSAFQFLRCLIAVLCGANLGELRTQKKNSARPNRRNHKHDDADGRVMDLK